MQFRNVIGQKAVKDHLLSMVNEERLSHALLFTGANGYGTVALALAFAQYVNCLNPIEGDSCGDCSSCRKMEKLIHPDFHFVFPMIKRSSTTPICNDYMEEWRSFVRQSPYFTEYQWYSYLKGERAQGLIYTSEGDQIIKKLSLKTFEGKYKIMVIWQPEKMHNYAANKLLKILEEPPARTLFLLVSDYSSGILPTILSRTQQVKIPKIDSFALSERLKQELSVSEDEAHSVARASGGNYIKARDIINSSEEKQLFHNMFVTSMRNAYSGQLDQINKWVDEAAALPKEQLKNLLQYCIDILRESYIANFNVAELVYATPVEEDFIKKFKSFVNDRNIESMVDEYALALSHIEQNGNNKLVLFDMSMKVSSLFRMSNNLA